MAFGNGTNIEIYKEVGNAFQHSQTIQGFQEPVKSLAFSKDGSKLLIVGRRALLYSSSFGSSFVKDEALAMDSFLSEDVSSGTISEDKSIILIGKSDGALIIYVCVGANKKY